MGPAQQAYNVIAKCKCVMYASIVLSNIMHHDMCMLQTFSCWAEGPPSIQLMPGVLLLPTLLATTGPRSMEGTMGPHTNNMLTHNKVEHHTWKLHGCYHTHAISLATCRCVHTSMLCLNKPSPCFGQASCQQVG